MKRAFLGLLAVLVLSAPISAQVKSLRLAEPTLGLSAVAPPVGTPQASAAPSVPTPSLAAPLVLTAAEVQVRAAEAGVAPETVAQHIQAAASLSDLQARFEASGLLKAGELDAKDEGGWMTLRYITHRLWAETPAKAKPAVEIDESRAIPSLVIPSQGVAYHIHGIAHGSVRPIQPNRVARLVSSLKKEGAALYSEQNLPAFYHYGYGVETLDHRVLSGQEIALRDVPAMKGLAAAASLALHRLLSWILPSSRPYFLWRFASLSRQAAELGCADMADYFARLGPGVYGRPWNLARALAAHLPMPLKAAIQPDVAARSKAMAEIIAKDAAAKGLKEVHILTGVNHAAELAWYLTH
jgi:hypothetical protein